jgi:fibro-slime domain-containing protein
MSTTPSTMVRICGLVVLAASQATMADNVLRGVVRDFRSEHADFNVGTQAAPIAGLVSEQLNADGHPVFTGAGTYLATPAFDADGNVIPAHLAGLDDLIEPAETVVISKDDMGDYQLDFLGVTYNKDGTSTWKYFVKEIKGHNISHWMLLTDPANVVAKGTTTNAVIGKDGSTGYSGVKWNVTGSFSEGTFDIVMNSHYPVVSGAVLIKASDTFGLGALSSPTPWEFGCPFHGDLEAVEGTSNNAGVSSASSFDQWFKRAPGYNVTGITSITFVDNGDGTQTFATNDYTPIDGEGYGNQNDEHNRYFTAEFGASFEFTECEGQFIEVESDGDVWVFVDGQLAMELSGGAQDKIQLLDLDRLDLDPNEPHEIRIFLADRNDSPFGVKITTNIEFRQSIQHVSHSVDATWD